ncbi:hypothetical protein sscle_16g110190 [Sclerotinia sclerotiorum 1980 UF-70]|uniref:DUF6536 domain-containing protein n=1 Tax=Sclerotinia sclerotiorum (strain ATCC 18683 / 1980 / Ss-1) TaxID=665079 RepID=A0A1D9QMZ9_SCLS1|nr:hypothetical protein sscle_16g110190 [Sclerotinia sclerotiorum 1980 UF-70]
MAARFSRLFDDWDQDYGDISMLEFGSNTNDSPREYHSSHIGTEYTSSTADLSERPESILDRSEATIDFTSCDNGISSRYLMEDGGSYAAGLNPLLSSAHNFQALRDVSRHILADDSPSEPRLRNGKAATSNMKMIWMRSTAFTKPRPSPKFDGRFAQGEGGWWKKQMLVDRTLRSMAGFTFLCAIIIFIIMIVYLPAFYRRLNKHSTSVGGKDGESCEHIESKNTAIHIFINIAATMILGCSNTYQQLITAPLVEEIPWILAQYGDAKIGLNSPLNINVKKSGKVKAWGSWLLLISTSIPVHFLANSVIGSSFYIEMPTNVTYNYHDFNLTSTQIIYEHEPVIFVTCHDSACWTSFRAGIYVLPNMMSDLSGQYEVEMPGKSPSFKTVSVNYNQNCTAYKGTASVYEALKEFDTGTGEYRIGNCDLIYGAYCKLEEPGTKKCRLNVRMQSCFTLFGCLLIKAIYMIGINYRARHRVKNNCLTYGDVIVASVINSNMKIHNECLLNSGDGYRHKVTHRCHKHCKDPVSSSSGDDIGHCQKCKKFNEFDKAADLPHPTMAIKYKRSLLSSLGSTAITQMLILMFCSFAMYHEYCRYENEDDRGYFQICGTSLSQVLKENYGTWGGSSSSATLTSLPPDKVSSELLAFAISNGAQFLFSLLYLLLIYNVTLIYMEREWGTFELQRKKPRATIVSGTTFEQSYFLQLPPKILLPLMTFAAAMHWLLGQSISTVESIYTDPLHGVEHSIYHVTYAAYPIFLSSLLMVGQTAVCWWAFTYRREGFIPQMYGSIRTCCASTSELEDFRDGGIQWGDLGMGESFRHAGFSNAGKYSPFSITLFPFSP